MRALTSFALVLCCAVALCRCAGPTPSGGAEPAATTTPQGAGGAIQAGQVDTLEIPVGRTVGADGGQLSVEFTAVESDSRCPSDVQCVRAGEAVVELHVAHGTRRAAMNLRTDGEPRAVEFEGYELSLADLDPYPATAQKRDPAAYVAKVAVRKR